MSNNRVKEAIDFYKRGLEDALELALHEMKNKDLEAARQSLEKLLSLVKINKLNALEKQINCEF